jgi:hypothetical protein
MINRFRLKIVDYFDSLVNYIDIKAEKALLEEQNTTNARVDSINENRNRLIETIKQVESINLAHLEKINIGHLENSTGDDEQINRAIFNKFCFRLKRSNTGYYETTGTFPFKFILVVTDQYLSRKSIDSFMQFLRYYEQINGQFDCDNIVCHSALNLADRFFKLKYDVNIFDIFLGFQS